MAAEPRPDRSPLGRPHPGGPRRVAAAGEPALLAALAVMVGALSVVPLARLLWEGVNVDGTPSPALLADVLTRPSTWRATLHSLQTAAGGTLLALLLGTLYALAVGLTDIRGKRALVFCALLPLMIPPQITALSWAQAFGPTSALLNTLGVAPPLGTPNPLYSPGGIALLLGIQHAPLVFLTLRAGLRRLPYDAVLAASTCGAGPWRTLRAVVLPLLTPALVAGGALAFVAALGNFGIPALLGIPINYSTLPTLIYSRLAGFGPAVIGEVAVLALLLGALAASGVLLQWRLLRGASGSAANARPLRVALGRWRPAVEIGCWLGVALMLVLPLTALLATSLVSAYGVPLSATTLTLDNYVEVLWRQSVTLRAFVNSGLLATAAALLLVVFAAPLAYLLTRRAGALPRLLALAAELPYALPGVVLAIACIMLFLKPLPLLGWSLYGTLWIIFVAYLARYLALALRPLISGFQLLDPAVERAAQAAGAGAVYRFRRVLLPLVAPTAAAGAILVFLNAVNELTVSALLWSSGTETLGVVVFNLDDGGFTVLAAALAALIVFAVVLLMLAAGRLARRLPPGVLPWEP